MSFGHHHHRPTAAHFAALEKIEREPWFKKAHAIPIKIVHDSEVPYLGGSSKPIGGVRYIFVDHRAYPLINRLGLLKGLITHEWVEGILLDHGYPYDEHGKGAHVYATAAENNEYEREGKDQTVAERHYPKILKLTEGEPITNIDPRLRLEPYRAHRENKRMLQQMLQAMRKAA